MTDVDPYLRSRPDRCSVCGWHAETQGHDPAVEHDVTALREAMTRATDIAGAAVARELRRVRPDPMSAPEPDTLPGAIGPTRTVQVPTKPPSRFDVEELRAGRPAWVPERPVEDVPLPDPPKEDERPW